MRSVTGTGSRALAAAAVLAAVFTATGCGTDGEPGKDRATGSGSPRSSPTSAAASPLWKFAHIADFDGEFTDVAALAEDDIWAVGQENNGNVAATLMHYDGSRWTREELPDALGRSDYPPKLDEIGEATLWLRPQGTGEASGTTEWAQWDGTEWSAVPHPPTGNVGDLEATGPDDIWALADERSAQHWDGSRWTTTRLPYKTADLAVVDRDDVWAVGRRSTGPGTQAPGGLPYDQPATMHWDGTSWRAVDTPVSRFEDPIPAEAGAGLTTAFVLDGGEVRAYGLNSFNHGEGEGAEPDDEYIRLRREGSEWVEQDPAPGGCELRVPVGQDDGGLLLDGNWYLSDDGTCVKVGRHRLPVSTGAGKSSNQSLWLSAVRRVPGTDIWLGCGHVQVNQSGAPFNAPVVVRLERPGSTG
ncbi:MULTISPECIES: hypothetical protein [unclassified Streptomyces]|uniref:hypothetical protein n=1 Tax=unclassified Streptomyces TaxID=2593676 RepID=UPI000DBAC3FA|nr:MULTISPECIES: hypothetical protein [unclassified Streptomyces]MYT74864.1 hypothetical protein [Streptomyces sp. SID8367]RAJ91851.1 hypothetical protein K377_00620 [Streptomyces sp. PsTaAH-137]